MPDREKVIRGLKAHAVIGMCGDNCPYYGCSGHGACSELLCADALSLLKAQEPEKPIYNQIVNECEEYTEYINQSFCAKCGAEFLWRVNYCPFCGQAVKWEK